MFDDRKKAIYGQERIKRYVKKTDKKRKEINLSYIDKKHRYIR